MKKKKISIATLSLAALLIVNISSTIALIREQQQKEIVHKADYTINMRMTKDYNVLSMKIYKGEV